MKNSFFIIPLTALTIVSFLSSLPVSKAQEMDSSSPQPTIIPDSSMNALDWDGTYEGVMPCASCEGIKTTLTLNVDRTFVLSTQYLGESEEVLEVKGTFQWNQEGNKITLDNIKDAPNQFLVGENTLIQLDMSGNRITGDLSSQYVLTKVKDKKMETDGTLINTRWELVEIMGKPVPKSDTTSKTMFITFNGENNRVNGFGGCNNFMGGFELKEGNRISLTQMASTMMACENMENEMEFMKMLQEADNYSLNDNVLILNRAKMAPLLKFVAVNE